MHPIEAVTTATDKGLPHVAQLPHILACEVGGRPFAADDPLGLRRTPPRAPLARPWAEPLPALGRTAAKLGREPEPAQRTDPNTCGSGAM